MVFTSRDFLGQVSGALSGTFSSEDVQRVQINQHFVSSFHIQILLTLNHQLSKCLLAFPLPRSHDTGSTLNHWPYPWKNLPEGYAYLLTHPGKIRWWLATRSRKSFIPGMDLEMVLA